MYDGESTEIGRRPRFSKTAESRPAHKAVKKPASAGSFMFCPSSCPEGTFSAIGYFFAGYELA
jgi:hypothetical protein